MINIFKKLEEEYSSFQVGELSLEQTNLNLLWILGHEEIYSKMINPTGVEFTHQILPLNKESLEEHNAIQKRILDGFRFDIQTMIDNLNENNYKEFNKLGMFLLEKLEDNMNKTEGKKKNESLKENFPLGNYHTKNIYANEDSLFVEMFFVEKFKEITHQNLLLKN